MTIPKKLLLILAVIITVSLLGYSTWHQWNANQETILERMRPIPPDATFAHGGSIRYIAFDPKDPETFACAGDGNIVKVWNRSNQDSPQLTLEAYNVNNDDTYMVGLAFSPTDNWIATKTFWTLEIWDGTSGNKIDTKHIPGSEFTISKTGNTFITASSHSNLKVWDIRDPYNITASYLLPPRIGWESLSLEGLERTFSHDGKSFTYHDIPNEYRADAINPEYDAIDSSHDGKWIAAGGRMLSGNNGKWGHKVKIWDLHNKHLFKIVERKFLDDQQHEQYNRKIRSIRFSPDNRFFAVADKNGLTIWSLPEWNIYHEVIDQRIRDMAFSPDGTMFAVCDVKGITLWSIETLIPVALLSGGGLLGSSVIAFSHDGSTLASGGYGGVLQLWEVSPLYEH